MNSHNNCRKFCLKLVPIFFFIYFQYSVFLNIQRWWLVLIMVVKYTWLFVIPKLISIMPPGCTGDTDTRPYILNLGTRWKSVVKFLPLPFTSEETVPCTHDLGSWIRPTSVQELWREEKSPTPARNQTMIAQPSSP
jgi:hypothetical protein